LIGATEGRAGVLDATWTAPTTNADGSALTGTTPAQITSPTTSPGTHQTVTSRLAGLTAGTRYNGSVTAVDTAGNESACSGVASVRVRHDDDRQH
jgi:hypothetical protein